MWIVRIILLVLQRKKHRFECGGSDAAGPVRAADEADGPLRQALAQVTERADRFIDWLLRVPGCRTEKAKVALFRLSPALYRLALKIRGVRGTHRRL